jgi:hypothetical protein
VHLCLIRFCAVKLAEGAIGDVNEGLPEGVTPHPPHHGLRVVALDSVDSGGAPTAATSATPPRTPPPEPQVSTEVPYTCVT